MNREEIEGERTKSSDLSGLYRFYPPSIYSTLSGCFGLVRLGFGLVCGRGCSSNDLSSLAGCIYIYIFRIVGN